MKSKKDLLYLLLTIIISLIGLSYAAVPLYQLFCQKTGFGGAAPTMPTQPPAEWAGTKNSSKSNTKSIDFTRNAAFGSADSEAEPLGPERQLNKVKALPDNAKLTLREAALHGAGAANAARPLHAQLSVPAAPATSGDVAGAGFAAATGPRDGAHQHQFLIQFNADTTDSMPIIFKPVQKELYVYPGQPALAFYIAENRTSQVITGVSTYNITPLKFGSYFIKIQCFCFEEQRFNPGEIVELPVLFVVSPEIVSELADSDPRLITLSYTFFRTNNEL